MHFVLCSAPLEQMEQHPVPQQISSYQFRLVGDMTLKQFFQLAAGIVVAIIIYSTPLHALLKWPLIFFFVLAGVALAFLPFEDRPLEKWVIAFFRSVYSPTIFVWKKEQVPPKYFRDEEVGDTTVPDQPKGVEGEKLNAYLSETGGTKTPSANKLEAYEKKFLAGIGSLFAAPQAAPVFIQPATAPAPVAVQGPTLSTVPQAVSADTVSPLASKGFGAGAAAEFSVSGAPPTPPTVPNTVVGQVLDSEGKIVESAILEIKDASGRPVRALRTNKLGHFTVVTPLQSGPYEIVTEKDGVDFDPVRFDAVGEIVEPIVIRATAPRAAQRQETNQLLGAQI